jgi:uroporphyrinogen decarboxylase
MQIEAGADAVQIFDSNAAVLPGHLYAEASLAWIEKVLKGLPEETPTILFSKGVGHRLRDLAATGARILSLDTTLDLPTARRSLGSHIGLQGNLDPEVLILEPEVAAREATRLLDQMSGDPSWIVNLGHGILPQANPDSMAALVETVTSAG